MSRLIYLDTNIYRDFLEMRTNRKGRPLDELSGKVFDRAVSCEFNIVISDWVIEQLSHQSMLEKSRVLFSELKERKKFIHVLTDNEDRIAARKSGNYDDYLHALLARKGNAEYLITRNIKDFIPFKKLIEPKLPENL